MWCKRNLTQDWLLSSVFGRDELLTIDDFFTNAKSLLDTIKSQFQTYVLTDNVDKKYAYYVAQNIVGTQLAQLIMFFQGFVSENSKPGRPAPEILKVYQNNTDLYTNENLIYLKRKLYTEFNPLDEALYIINNTA